MEPKVNQANTEIREMLKEMQTLLDNCRELEDDRIVPLFQEVNRKIKGVEKGITLNLLALNAVELFSAIFPHLSESVQRSFIDVALIYWMEKRRKLCLAQELEPFKHTANKVDRRCEPADKHA